MTADRQGLEATDGSRPHNHCTTVFRSSSQSSLVSPAWLMHVNPWVGARCRCWAPQMKDAAAATLCSHCQTQSHSSSADSASTSGLDATTEEEHMYVYAWFCMRCSMQCPLSNMKRKNPMPLRPWLHAPFGGPSIARFHLENHSFGHDANVRR